MPWVTMSILPIFFDETARVLTREPDLVRTPSAFIVSCVSITTEQIIVRLKLTNGMKQMVE